MRAAVKSTTYSILSYKLLLSNWLCEVDNNLNFPDPSPHGTDFHQEVLEGEEFISRYQYVAKK
jgi:hypothetical protein